MKPIRMLAVVGGLTSALLAAFFVPVAAQTDISPEALQQIQDLLQEKESRTEVQRKLGSRLLYALKESLGQPLAPSVDVLPSVESLDNGAYGVLVDMHALEAPWRAKPAPPPTRTHTRRLSRGRYRHRSTSPS